MGQCRDFRPDGIAGVAGFGFSRDRDAAEIGKPGRDQRYARGEKAIGAAHDKLFFQT